jgi:NRPS condensation-like uncharacterized protein
LIKFLLTPQERNCIHNGKKLTGKKNAAVSKNISVEQVKTICKKMGVTINDVIMTLTCMTLKEYMISKGDTKTKKVNLCIPFSLREELKRTEDFEIENDFSLLSITLDLENEFSEGLKQVKRRMDAVKKSIEPFGMYYLIGLALMLPSLLTKLATAFLADKMTLVFSNVPGPKTPWTILGKKVKSLMFFVPGLANIGSGLSIISHADVFKIGCVGDFA